MTQNELAESALNSFDKGYIEDFRYCDDLYDATKEEKNLALDLMEELCAIGSIEFSKKYLSKEK